MKCNLNPQLDYSCRLMWSAFDVGQPIYSMSQGNDHAFSTWTGLLHVRGSLFSSIQFYRDACLWDLGTAALGSARTLLLSALHLLI